MPGKTLLKKRIDSLPHRSAAFLEPMECLAVSKLPEGSQWVYEIKLDGYRALGIKSNGSVRLLSRRNNSFKRQYPLIVEGLAELPEDTVVDGEVVALDASGFPDFNLLQNYRTEASRIHFFVFDLLVYQGRDLTRLPLIERREIVRSALKFSSGRVRISVADASRYSVNKRDPQRNKELSRERLLPIPAYPAKARHPIGHFGYKLIALLPALEAK